MSVGSGKLDLKGLKKMAMVIGGVVPPVPPLLRWNAYLKIETIICIPT